MVSSITNFPNGVSSYGVPLLGPGGQLPVSGNYLFVSSTSGADGNVGGYDSPMATIDAAINRTIADQGWVIVCLPGHVETIIAASGITMDVAGVTVTSLGIGNDRAVITFGTATTASIVFSAANCAFTNMVCVAGINALSNPLHLQAAGLILDVQWQDGSASVESARAILTTAAADRLTVTLDYRGFTAGSSCVNAIRLVGCNDANISLRAYGKASTAWVEFVTTACTDINVAMWGYNSGTTNGTKNVVDTVTGSTWYANITDATAGTVYTGGSGSALASDDVSTIAANQTVPTADSTANVLERDPIGNKTDATTQTVGTTASNVAYLKGVANALVGAGGVATWPASAAKGNGVTMAAVLGLLSDNTWRTNTVSSASPLTTGTLFTYAGTIEFKLVGRVTTVVQSQATTIKLSVVADAFAAYDICGTVDANAFTAGTLLSITGTAAGGMVATTSRGAIAPSQVTPVVATCVTSGTITVTFGAASTGAISWMLYWRPITSSATVT